MRPPVPGALPRAQLALLAVLPLCLPPHGGPGNGGASQCARCLAGAAPGARRPALRRARLALLAALSPCPPSPGGEARWRARLAGPAGPRQRRAESAAGARGQRRAPALRAAAGQRGNPYDVLGLPRGAEESSVRPAFRKLATRLHPDVPGTGDAEAFREAAWAYKELSDSAGRQRWAVEDDAPRHPTEYETTEYDYSSIWEDLEQSPVRARSGDMWDELLEAVGEDAGPPGGRPPRARRRRRRRRVAREPFVWEEEWWDTPPAAGGAGRRTAASAEDQQFDDLWEARMRQSERRQAEEDGRTYRSKMSAVRRIVEGSYAVGGSNHGGPVYRKPKAGEVDVDTAVYFWDDRDGSALSGWWIGIDVGGDTVFAFSESTDPTAPPSSGWRLPVAGPVDPSLRATVAPGPGGALRLEFGGAGAAA